MLARDPSSSAVASSASRSIGEEVMEEVLFLEADGSTIFVMVQSPRGRPSFGVVVCSPIKAELTANMGRERRLATRLASMGLLAVRFHPRGEGNSGDVEGQDLDTVIEDALRVADWVRDRYGVSRVGFVGTRLGSVAAAAAAAASHAPLVVWAPVAEPKQYWRELDRVNKSAAIASGADAESVSLIDALDAGEAVDLLGFEITPRMYRSVAAHPIIESAAGAGPVLVVWLGHTGATSARLGEGLRAAGHEVQVVQVRGAPAWWLLTIGEEREQGDVDDEAVVDATASWLGAVLGGGRP